MKKSLFFVSFIVCSRAYATDVNNFNDFYNAYKNYATENSINMTGDITSTRLISVPGAESTIINGGGFGFDGGAFNGFTVSNGYVMSLTNGGGFTVSGQTANVNSSFNKFYQSGQGAVFANLGGSLTVSDSAFTNNSARLGGGVFYQSNNASLIVSDSVFEDNSTTRNGGVIYTQYGTNAIINNSFFQGNSSGQYGGVAFNDGNLTISNGVFVSNTASSGAAIYNSNTITLSEVYFSGNTGSQGAGAIYSTGMMELENGTFENNAGQTGGAISNYGIVGDTLYAVVKSSSFTGNSATYGGAVYNWDDMYIIDSSFTNNSATDNGGAIFNLNALFLIAQNADIVFSGNTVSGESNAIYSSESLFLNAAPQYQITFNDKITGSGSLIVNRAYELENDTMPSGGTIVLNEDMSGFTGNVTIESGVVTVTDSGNFFNANDLTVSGGVLNLGLTNATVTSANFQSGAILRLSVQDANNYGFLTSDSFNISENAAIDVVLGSNAMSGTDSLRLQLLRSNQVITDNFFPEINNNIYDFIKLGNGWYEVVEASSILDVIKNAGGTQNNENTALGWQDMLLTDNSVTNEVYEKLNELVQLDAVEYIKALTALAPSPAPLMQTLGNSYINRFDGMVHDRQEYYVGKGLLWGAMFGSGGKLKENDFYADFDAYGYGLGLGAEYNVSNWNLGAAYTYQYDELTSWARSIKAPTHGIGIYAKYDDESLVWNNYASFFYTDMDETKNVAGIHLFDNTDVYTTGVWSDIGYVLPINKLNVIPYIGTRYMSVHRGSSVDTAGQEISNANLDFLTTYARLSAEYNFSYDDELTITPIIELGASYDWHAAVEDINVLIMGNEYSIATQRLSHWQTSGGIKLKLGVGEVYDVTFGADFAIRQGYYNYSGNIRGVLRF